MKVRGRDCLQEARRRHRQAKSGLDRWERVVELAQWDKPTDVKRTFNHADIYKTVTIFDVCGNKYRLITKICYQAKSVSVLWFFTHEEYDKDKWKAKI